MIKCRFSVNTGDSKVTVSLQSEKAVTAYLKSKQLLPFGFARQTLTRDLLLSAIPLLNDPDTRMRAEPENVPSPDLVVTHARALHY